MLAWLMFFHLFKKTLDTVTCIFILILGGNEMNTVGTVFFL